ncbi:MAG: TIGR03915 family putative DNA repair protein [Oscillospiraceae bacterium]|nr:TIGR03915 family putative DNA repair protein [Oscillospiraceae bacterium]
MTAYRYDGTFAGFLTCAWDALEGGTEPSAFLLPGDGATLWEERQVTADQGRARRLYAALSRRVSPAFQKLIARGFLTCLPEKELALLTLIRRGLREGDRVRLDLSDPVMARVNLALTKMWTEWDHLKGFVRFSELDGVLVGEIEPKNRVLPLLAPHFAARYSGERLALYDRTHHEIFLSDRGRWKLLPAEDFRMGPAGSGERACRAMWRRYYDTIAIEGRTNPKCQSTHLPKRYRHVMTEFLTDEEMERSLPGQAPTASLEDGTQAHSSTSTTRT